MKNQKNLTASLENYLKAVFYIVEEKKAARVKDISKHMGVGASSVSEALKILSERNLINYEPYGIITLTEEGEKSSHEIIKRRKVVRNFFEKVLSIDPEIAKKNSESMKHCVCDDVFSKFVMFLEFMQTCSCKDPKWMKGFKYYSTNGELHENCSNCIAKSKENPDLRCNGSCCGKIQ